MRTVNSVLLITVAVWLFGCTGDTGDKAGAAGDSPNFVIIYCDDLGYGDLG